MKNFAQLFTTLDQTTKTNAKVAALVDYFGRVGDKDRLWTIAILSSRRPKRSLKTSQLREWAAELAQVPLWLFKDSYHVEVIWRKPSHWYCRRPTPGTNYR